MTKEEIQKYKKEKSLLPIFYTYIYLDSRKPGKFQYPGSSASFLFEPIYIGKGHGGRMGNAGGSYLKNKVNKIRREGFEVIMFKLLTDVSEREAFNDEIVNISAIGRKRTSNGISLGPLCNLTDGGDGFSGLSWICRITSKETREKISKLHLGSKRSKIARENMSKAQKGLKRSPEACRNNSIAQTGKVATKEARENISKAQKGRKRSEEAKRNISIGKTGKSMSDDAKKSMSKARKDKLLYHNGKTGKYLSEDELYLFPDYIHRGNVNMYNKRLEKERSLIND